MPASRAPPPRGMIPWPWLWHPAWAGFAAGLARRRRRGRAGRDERSGAMKPKHALVLGLAATALAVLWAAPVVQLGAQPAGSGAVRIDNDDIGGVVTGPHGPEAGVWVIAETSDLPTKFVRIVVTHDAGRYVIPELPKANYNVWVRGYGLV